MIGFLFFLHERILLIDCNKICDISRSFVCCWRNLIKINYERGVRMELFEYQNRLLQEDGLAAKDNCEKVLSEIATKYKMSDAELRS